MSIQSVALYLPQYHPIPENDMWWGTGFTEWRNVAKAKPRFLGHYQPHHPSDLGFYDLRLVETLYRQAKLAHENGIYAFCFYHYWFNGKLLLETPVEQFLNEKGITFPFCLCWANENWTRRWDGMDHEILLSQHYSSDDDVKHYMYLEQFFSDSRYLKVGGKPVIIVYRRSALPEPERTCDLWRHMADKSGFPGLYIVSVETGPTSDKNSAQSAGFDAELDFQPQWGALPPLRTLLKLKNPYLILHGLLANKMNVDSYFSYSAVVDHMVSRTDIRNGRIPCVFPSWDNSPRRKRNATIFLGSTPNEYMRWLDLVIAQKLAANKSSDNLVFINAWNEWGEGAHLEPDLENESAYLNATRQVLLKFNT